MKNKRWLLIYIGGAAAVVLLNLLAWNSTAFSDAYIAYVFPLWVSTYGRLTGLAGFSVGEIMLAAGAALAAMAVLLGVVCLFAEGAVRAGSGRAGKEARKIAHEGRFWRFVKKFYLFFVWALLAVSLVMTLNCFILYHATPFSEIYFGEDDGSYTLEELTRVRNFVLEQCNELASEMVRGGEGEVLYEGDMEAQAIVCMKELGLTYGRLAGYYPRPKPLAASDFFCQQYMQGYYFPFSMEANYNDVMYIMNKPNTMCHELAHLRGYIFEDEANFISYLACTRSGDTVFQYSGYLSVLNYLDNDLYRAVGREAYAALPQPSALVRRDNIFVEEKEWDRINRKALIDTETVDQVSDVLVDVTLKANGVADGSASYSRVVRLLLQYYRSVGGVTTVNR